MNEQPFKTRFAFDFKVSFNGGPPMTQAELGRATDERFATHMFEGMLAKLNAAKSDATLVEMTLEE